MVLVKTKCLFYHEYKFHTFCVRHCWNITKINCNLKSDNILFYLLLFKILPFFRNRHSYIVSYSVLLLEKKIRQFPTVKKTEQIHSGYITTFQTLPNVEHFSLNLFEHSKFRDAAASNWIQYENIFNCHHFITLGLFTSKFIWFPYYQFFLLCKTFSLSTF